MVDTTFVDGTTVIVSTWLQDVNNYVYRAGAGGGGSKSTNGLNSFTATVAANALTITFPAQSIDFRNISLPNGAPVTRVIPSPITLTIPSGVAVGTTNGGFARLFVGALDVGDGTVQVAVLNPTIKTVLDEDELATSFAIASSGAGAANTVYSNSALAGVPYRVMGWIEITEATAGVWATAPSTVQPNGGYGVTAALIDLAGIGNTAGNSVGGSTSTNGLNPFTAVCTANTLVITVPAQIIHFRSPTLNDGSVFVRTITTPLVLTIPNGATLGTTNGVLSQLIVGVLDLGNGSVDVGVYNPSPSVAALIDEDELTTATAISGAANSKTVVYANANYGAPGLPYRIMGWIEITEATAGVWATQPSTVQPNGGMGVVRALIDLGSNINPPPPSPGQLGYLGIPPNTQSANYTTVASDNGKYIYHPAADVTARTYTIDASVTYSTTGGAAITFVNMSVGAVSVAISGGTLYWSPTGTVGTRTVAQYGELTALQIGTTTGWLATGSGVT